MKAAAMQPDLAHPVMKLDPRKIDPNPEQPRRFFFSPGDIDDAYEDEPAIIRQLAENILVASQIEPIVVRSAPKGRFMVIVGERRLRAAKLLSEELGEPWFIDAVIRDDIPPDKILDVAIAENAARQGLTDIEQIWCIQRLMARNRTEADIATLFGRNLPWAKKRCLIAMLPADVIRQMHPDNMPRLRISVAYEIAKRRFSETEARAIAFEVQPMPSRHAVGHIRVHHTPESATPRRGRPSLTIADQMIRSITDANAQINLFLRVPGDSLAELFSGRRRDAQGLANELGTTIRYLTVLRNRINKVA
jgi:ParB/RepB/Spo0J family partition protein